jgi:hypothetical protein
MADSGSSPSHPSSLVVPGRDWRQIGGGGEGHGLGLHVVLMCPISTRETAATYTRPLGCDLNSSTEPANCGLATVVMWICGSYCE